MPSGLESSAASFGTRIADRGLPARTVENRKALRDDRASAHNERKALTMKLVLHVGLAAALGGLTFVARAETRSGSPATQDRKLVVVERFQSQGCSSCPPAQDNLNALADRPDVLALSFAVTYWDYLGWKDRFVSPKFTARQWDYAHRNGFGQVATPQAWINGRTTINGGNRRELETAIASARGGAGPSLALSGNKLTIGAGQAPTGRADVWLVRYDPRTVHVAIRAGENGGRTLPHRDIVRELVRIGRWTGAPLTLAVSSSSANGLKSAVLVQGVSGGSIIAALRV